MLGTEDQEGIMVLTLKELFDKININSSEREYKVKLLYIEIYNENIRDLLSTSEEYLDLREDPTKGVSISNINELNVTSCADIMQLLKKGNRNRTQEATNANETSSRSHAILQVQVEYRDKASGLDVEIRSGKLSMIDLAGSERASATQNRGIRLIEGANINRSLLTLGNCINALCEASEKGTKPHVPYRDSKLTRLLKVKIL
jgi:kinesin family protein 18/19